jgi:hypothetical protein
MVPKQIWCSGLEKIAPVDELFVREANPKPHGAHFKQLLFAVVANCNKSSFA